MITLGCDIGSLFSKVAVMDGDDIVASGTAATTGNIESEIKDLIDGVLKDAGIDRGNIECTVATGNGADLVKDAGFVEDEVTCVAAAAYFYIDKVDMAIHIGGQSITAMSMDEDGEVTNLMHNDKCASGSGRFLEAMSRKLNIEITDIDPLAAQSDKDVLISNQCAVFAESEVITHVNNGEKLPDIFAGICASVANMVVAQGRRFSSAEDYTLTGGVTRIGSVVDVINSKLSGNYHAFPHDPGLAAAIGAALLGATE